MNIVLASDLYFPTLGGISVATHNLAVALSQRKHTVSLFVPSVSLKTSKEKISSHLTIYRIGSYSLFAQKGIRFAFDIRAVISIVKKIKPDIIHAMTVANGTIGLAILQTAKKNHIPIVATNHILPENLTALFHMPPLFTNELGKLTMQHIINTYQQLDYLISPSEAGENYLRQLGVTIPIEIISNGIELEKFTLPKQEVLQQVTNRFHLKEQPKLLYTGRLDGEKGLDTLLNAFAKLPQSLNAQLIIVGRGTEMKRMQELVHTKDLATKVIFTGFLSDEELIAMYHLSTIFVMPSPVELQSLSTMEAMAAKLPIIGANAMALPYLIHNEKNGLLFHPGKSTDLKEKLERILKDSKLREQMGEKSFTIIKKHTMEQVVVKFEQLYNQLVV